jgi:hypothetical protein
MLMGAVFLLICLNALHCVALEWYIEDVDTAGTVGQYNSLALDDAGLPHISYYDNTNRSLKYTFWNGFAWETETVHVDTTGMLNIGLHSTLALDNSGNPHVCYDEVMWGPFAYTAIKYSRKEGPTWLIEWGAWFGHDPSIALDYLGHPHISYTWVDPFGPTPTLNYAFSNGAGWFMDTDIAFGWHSSLALDHNGHPHLSYEGLDDSLMHAHKASAVSGWESELVDVGLEPSLAVDEAGNPHVCYRRNSDVAYAFRNASGWHIETVAEGGYPVIGFGMPSLALDADGDPRIVFTEVLESGSEIVWILSYCEKRESGWEYYPIEELSFPDYAEPFLSLALDADGCPHVSYYWGDSDLRYACPILHLSAALEAEWLVLTWSDWPWTAGYQVYGAMNQVYFQPNLENLLAELSPDSHSWATLDGIGVPKIDWTYLVIAVDDADQEIMRSNYCGEHDFGMDIP